jgi:hypothetical protein
LAVDLQNEWQAMKISETHVIKAINAIVEAWKTDKAKLADAMKRIEELETAAKPPGII